MSVRVAASRSESQMKVSSMFSCLFFFLNWASNKHVNFPNYYKQLNLSAAHKNIT